MAIRFTAETRVYLKCKISPRLTGRGGRTYGRFSQNQNFLDAQITKLSYPWCSAARARETSASISILTQVLALFWFRFETAKIGPNLRYVYCQKTFSFMGATFSLRIMCVQQSRKVIHTYVRLLRLSLQGFSVTMG